MSVDDEFEQEINESIAILLEGKPRPRGRPKTGFGIALGYTQEVWELRQRGVRPSHAVAKVAKRHGITEIHVYACMRKVATIYTPLRFWSPVVPSHPSEFGCEFILVR
jgi:hypothetical protein